MASLPRPAAQRRQSPHDADHAVQDHGEAARTSSFSAASDDSQTVLLNPSRSEAPQSQSAFPRDNTISKPTKPAVADSAVQENIEPRTCWICFNDETEDDENSSEWRSPCPCVLTAHEKCLLDWIADMEAPSAGRQAGTAKRKILCPQCKNEIRIQRPRNLVVDFVRLGERLANTCLLPGLAVFVGSATYTTLASIGRVHILQIFGPRDALDILHPISFVAYGHRNSVLLRLMDDLRQHWRLRLGLPMIPTALILSRTTLIDSFLPFLPLIFFVGSGAPPQHDILQLQWPPSAAFTISALPYIRSLYNTYYEHVWLPQERKWLKEIQPRNGAESEEAGNVNIPMDGHDHDHNHDHDHDHDHEHLEGDEHLLEVDVDFDILGNWNNGDADVNANNNVEENPDVPAAAEPVPAQEGQQPPEQLQGDGQAAPAPDVPLQQQAPRERRVRREFTYSTASIADTILGALVFPSVAAAVGEALRMTLPKTWVTAPRWGKPTGFLQTRWGRSILGGCLFVGMKDAVMLYVRWKMAQNHRKRHILDYDKSKGKRPASGRS